jgi:hypothetical protein
MPALTRDSNPSRAVIFRVRSRARSCAASSSPRECTFPFVRVLTFFGDVFTVKHGSRSQICRSWNIPRSLRMSTPIQWSAQGRFSTLPPVVEGPPLHDHSWKCPSPQPSLPVGWGGPGWAFPTESFRPRRGSTMEDGCGKQEGVAAKGHKEHKETSNSGDRRIFGQ